MAGPFGPDNCYGLSWTLLHLIETAPGAVHAVYPHDAADDWLCRLTHRRGAACSHTPN